MARVTLPVGPDRSDGSAKDLDVAGAGVSAGVAAEGIGNSGCEPDELATVSITQRREELEHATR